MNYEKARAMQNVTFAADCSPAQEVGRLQQLVDHAMHLEQRVLSLGSRIDNVNVRLMGRVPVDAFGREAPGNTLEKDPPTVDKLALALTRIENAVETAFHALQRTEAL